MLLRCNIEALLLHFGDAAKACGEQPRRGFRKIYLLRDLRHFRLAMYLLYRHGSLPFHAAGNAALQHN